MSAPEVRARCRRPDCRVEACARVENAGSIDLRCAACGENLAGCADAGWCANGVVRSCPCCGCREAFVRKDFPQRLGLAIVMAAALVSIVLLYRHTLAALGVLAGVVLIDAVVYLFVTRVTVCYRCRAEFRRFSLNPEHEAFDLATAEKYPQPFRP